MRVTLQDRVIKYLQEEGSITSMEAFQYIGVTRLSAVIFNLKKDGYAIKTEPESSLNRYGDKVTFAKYSFYDEKGEKE